MVFSQLLQAIVIYGGSIRPINDQTHLKPQGELYMWSLASGTWTTLSRLTDRGGSVWPAPRYCHTCSVWTVKNKKSGSGVWKRKKRKKKEGEEIMVCFGGIQGRGSGSIRRVNEVWFFDFGTQQWSLQNCKGEPPDPRTHCTSAVYGNTFIIFGGLSVGDRSNETWFLDLTTTTWTKCNVTGSIPLPRLSASCSLYRHYFVVFGGYIRADRVSDVHLLDLRTLEWKKTALKRREPGWKI